MEFYFLAASSDPIAHTAVDQHCSFGRCRKDVFLFFSFHRPLLRIQNNAYHDVPDSSMRQFDAYIVPEA